MRNLKRALSFALACIMLVGLMVVGTSAAFADDADIVNTEAAEMLVALGIVNGKPGNKFDPTGVVTRGEMAKMICVALNGGKDPALTEGGMYPDTKTHWARGYIDYCTNLGIVSGDTAGNFNPDKTVTGTEAAKMVLTALGYNAVNEKFVNDANWANNINVVASMKGLFEELNILPSAPLTRDDAAQMIWNGLNAEMVKYVMVGIVNGTSVSAAEDITGKTILKNKFKTEEFEGELTKTSYNATKKEYTYTVGSETFTSAKDYSNLYGMDVTVVYKTVNGEPSVFGIIGEGKVMATALYATVKDVKDDTTKIEVGGAKYATEKSVATLAKLAFNEGAKTPAAYDMVNLIDADGNGKADTVVFVPFTVAEITYVGKETFKADTNTITTKNVVAYTGMAKGDFVKVTAKANTLGTKDVYEKLETVKAGKVAAIKGSEYKIGAEWFKTADGSALTLGTSYKKMPVVNGYIFAKTVDTGSTSVAVEDYAVLLKIVETNGFDTYAEAKVLKTDGTTAIVKLHKDSAIKTAGDYAQLITMTEKDGTYKLTAVSGKGAYDAAETGSYKYVKNGKSTIADIVIADDAIIFIKGSKSTTVITGAELKGTDTKNITAVYNAYSVKDSTTGFSAIKMAYVAGSIAKENALTGYVTADKVNVLNSDNKSVYEITLWNGTEPVTLTTKDGVDTTAAVKGAVVSYKVEKGLITEIKTVDVKAAAIAAYNGELVKFDGVAQIYDIDKDTVVLYIDSSKKVAYAEGVITLASKDGDTLINNVAYAADSDNDVTYLIVDVNNEYK